MSVHLSLTENSTLHVQLPIPIRSICPGQVHSFIRRIIALKSRPIVLFQYAVFYNGNEVLGAARIADSGTSLYDLQWTEPLVNSDLLLNMY